MIVLEGNPKSTQQLYRHTCRGKFATVYMTKVGKDMKEKYKEEITNQYKGVLREDDISMELHLFFGDKRIRDIDNFNKLILDALSGIVYKDDKQIKRLLITKNYNKIYPRVEVIIN